MLNGVVQKKDIILTFLKEIPSFFFCWMITLTCYFLTNYIFAKEIGKLLCDKHSNYGKKIIHIYIHRYKS